MDDPANAETVTGLTDILLVTVAEHPLVVPVMVYVVVAVAEQVTVAPVDALNPVAGSQL